MLLSINFSDGTKKKIEDTEYVPNIGDAIHNEADIGHRYFVTGKDVYFSENWCHIIISATKPKIQ